MTQPWLRQAEVLVGPLYEWQADRLQAGPSNKQEVLRVYSDGSQDTLRVKFNVRLHAGYIAPASTIEIYNIGAPLRAALNKPYTAVVLRAGWMNTGLEEIFSGSLMAAYSRREGADIITTLAVVGGFGDTNRSYAGIDNGQGLPVEKFDFLPGTPLKSVVKQLAENFPIGQEGVDLKNIIVPDAKLGYRGLSVTGKIMDILNDLGRNYGFSWWVAKGQFHAVTDRTVPDGPAVLVSYKNNMLLRAEPLLMGAWQMYGGMTFRSLLYPQIRQGSVVKIESQINAFLNAAWYLWEVTHTGDTRGGPWYTDGVSLVVQQGN